MSRWHEVRRFIRTERDGDGKFLRLSPSERFWEKVEKTDGCWLWRAGVDNRDGYGKFLAAKGRTVRAHRFASPTCVNPEHLVPGTQKENIADRESRGRSRWQRRHQEGRA
jgi:hypothetical protein